MLYRSISIILLFGAILLSKELIILNEEILVASCFFLLITVLFTYGKEPINAILESRALDIMNELESYLKLRQKLSTNTLESLNRYSTIINNIEGTKSYCIDIAEISQNAASSSVQNFLNNQTELILSDIEKELRADKNQVLIILHNYIKRVLLKKQKTVKKVSKKSVIEETRRRLLSKIKSN